MSTSRKASKPESHLVERYIADRPARSWGGYVRIADGEHTMFVPGTWHLDLPDAPRPMMADARRAVPLPDADDPEAWRAHLLRLIRLQHPRMQLRVMHADEYGWQQLELAAPTVPPSVVHLDRHGMARVLGQDARLSMIIDAGTTHAGPADPDSAR